MRVSVDRAKWGFRYGREQRSERGGDRRQGWDGGRRHRERRDRAPTWRSATAASWRSARTSTGDVVIDATGCVVTPGFIDIHTHYDAQVFWDPALTPVVLPRRHHRRRGQLRVLDRTDAADDRELIAHTLEKVEDMDPASLNAGIPWEFETFPEYLDTVVPSRHGAELRGVHRAHAAADLRDGRRRVEARRRRRRRSSGWRRWSREAMDAGAAGFATSFAVTHLGADGQPIPSRWAAA